MVLRVHLNASQIRYEAAGVVWVAAHKGGGVYPVKFHPAQDFKDKVYHPVRHFQEDIHNVADFVVLVFDSDVGDDLLDLFVDTFKRTRLHPRTDDGCKSFLAVVGKLLLDYEGQADLFFLPKLVAGIEVVHLRS